MKKLILFLLVLTASVVRAQDVAQPEAPSAFKFGYLSYDIVLKSMPEYPAMQNDLTLLRQKYEAEQLRVEEDFNKKYEEFLDGQKNFPKTILQKRQSELQEILDRNIAFKKESQRLLIQAEKEALQPLTARLNDALSKIGTERGYAFILNTDLNVTPWLNMNMGEDITEEVKEVLQQQ